MLVIERVLIPVPVPALDNSKATAIYDWFISVSGLVLVDVGCRRHRYQYGYRHWELIVCKIYDLRFMTDSLWTSTGFDVNY